jgi:hypothetical protein
VTGFRIYIRASRDASESPLPAVIATRAFALGQARRLSLPRPGDGPAPFYVAVYSADYFSVPPVAFRNGTELPGEVPCGRCGAGVFLAGGEWSAVTNGTTDCPGVSTGYAPHDPVPVLASTRR